MLFLQAKTKLLNANETKITTMKRPKTLMSLLLGVASVMTLSSFTVAEYDSIKVAAPFPMPAIAIYNFPHNDFSIADYGAKKQGTDTDENCTTANTEAFKRAMQACNEAGGGRVVVPDGVWPCGPIHFKSNCELHLSDGATVLFSSDPERFLPAVEVSWEGLECMNYSPMVYAYQCENIAITGGGKLTPDMIHFNQCRNVLLDGFKIRNSPFWTIHMYRCEGGVVRNLDVYAHGHNNDGIDIEMTRNFLIEDCVFDQGDDGVVIKSGRNHDAWRIGRPTENIVVRNCRVRNAHGLLVVGSEISGGIRNVYMHDCSMDDKVITLFYLKTNHRRGAFIENIYMERVSANRMQRAFAVDTDVLYQWKDLVPTYKDSITAIRNIFMRDVRCHEADGIYEINGDKRLPVKNVNIENLEVDTVRKYTTRAANVEGLNTKNIKWKAFAGKEDK